jgi:hypothetical protein
MFRITRGITSQYAPAFSPIFRFPDGTLLPIHGDDEADDAPPAAPSSAGAIAPSAAPDADGGEGAASTAETGPPPS